MVLLTCPHVHTYLHTTKYKHTCILLQEIDYTYTVHVAENSYCSVFQGVCAFQCLCHCSLLGGLTVI